MKRDQIKRRIGQMFVVGFEGTNVSPDLKNLIENYYIGGIVLFERNITSPKQVAELVNEAQSLSKTPLFVAVDQEGGSVTRLKAPFTQFGGARAFTITDSPKLTFEAHYAMAQELRAVGINTNFSPVVDVDTNPKNPIIGNRSFSSDPQIVAKMASGAIRGLQRGGVIACAKHFPGHGDTSTDSHLELPVVKHNLERLRAIEWLPFDRVIRGGVEMVMTAHILNPTLDPDFPATLSVKTLHHLREDLRFQKIIITDDLEMEAISKIYPIEEAVLKSIAADGDMLLICRSLEKQFAAMETVLKEVVELKIPMKRLEESSERITKVRNRYILPYKPVDLSEIDTIVGCEEHQKLASQLKPTG